MRKYEFNWDMLGVEDGRPNLGNKVGIEVYRLMHFTLRDVLEQKLGSDEADQVFYNAGRLAGKRFYEQFIHPVDSVEEFVSKTQRVLKEQSIGILKIEEALLDEGKVMLTVDEDLDCSGLPESDYETCIYDEGFIASLFEGFTNKGWRAKEVDCWCTGARTCRFLVTEEV